MVSMVGGRVFRVRLAEVAEVPRLRAVDVAAGRLFRAVGMAEVAAHPPPSGRVLAEYVGRAAVWVAVPPGGRPAGFVLTDVVDGLVHVAQLSVHPAFGRRGAGRLLLDRVVAEAAAAGVSAVTLTTFRDVPWNGPFYAGQGFVEWPRECWGAGLRELWRCEEREGLTAWPRLVMRRVLVSSLDGVGVRG
ncbi:N-acetyltransferase [Pilimelia terevasa]|uniref:N-acetyltransferase n=1 Tax=Pilimelia terevasa TaxID=53372 RepID=A0A8J3BTA9_9ACTN|nr:GNAT family N-acetyltransferase [Pilimelia terevasa]GGK37468.1 N-acetyltransferase [Pilimelia terevasa]